MFGMVHSILMFLPWPTGWRGSCQHTVTFHQLCSRWNLPVLLMCLKVSVRCHCWVWILVFLGWESCQLGSFPVDSDTNRSAIWQRGTLCPWGWRQFEVKALLVSLENLSFWLLGESKIILHRIISVVWLTDFLSEIWSQIKPRWWVTTGHLSMKRIPLVPLLPPGLLMIAAKIALWLSSLVSSVFWVGTNTLLPYGLEW